MKVKLLYILSFLIFLAACSKKHIPQGDSLFIGADVKVEGASKAKEKKALRKEMEGLVRPHPNSKFLGMRLKLWANSIPFIGKRFGEPPVLASSVNFEKNNQVLQNRLENRGYFHAKVSFDTVTKRRKTKVDFTAVVGPQYTINSVSFPQDSSKLSIDIASTAPRSLLKVGDPYDLDIIKAERSRIDTRLKNTGYFYFSPEYIIVNVDSTIGNHKVDLMLRVKPETPGDARAVYKVRNIIVHADYGLQADTTSVSYDSTLYRGFYIINPNNKFKPKMFDRTLVIDTGEIYSRNEHNLSLNRLISLGVYKFVKVQFEDVQTDTAHLLDAYYYLTPLAEKSIRFEAGGLTKSNNSTGSEVTLSWKHRNLMSAGELFTISGFVGVERQIAGQQPAVTTNRLGGDLNLVIPRVTFPLRFNTSSEFVPQTKFNVGYELFNRSSQYTLNSFKLNTGYVWKEHINKEHQLNVISINYVYPLNITQDFQDEIIRNLNLQRSIERQFIIGSNYNFNYNTQTRPNRRLHNFYFNGNVDLSGNLLGLITGAKASDKKYIFNVPFAQYIRFEPEIRHYLKLGTKPTDMWASRMIIGVGYAYGNSEALPFTKSFFIGGTNSVRAFRARSLGPGTYYGGNADTARRFLPDQPGDLKFEINTEWRFNLSSIFNGALFVDAGNIWTLNEDPNRPGAKFTGKFLSQLAVGVGVGLRIDLDLIIVRGDLAFPIRKPFLQGPQWVVDQINLRDSRWRRENMIFNLAIGYPF